MKELNIVKSGVGMSQKTVTPCIKDSAKIIVDSRSNITREDFKAKGYEVKVVSLEKYKCRPFDPYKALKELAEEDPIKFGQVVAELKDLIKKDR